MPPTVPPTAEPPPAWHQRATGTLHRLALFGRRHPWISGLILLAIGLVLAVAALMGHYSRMIDQKLSAGAFQGSAMVFASPQTLEVGDSLRPGDVIAQLQRSGYSTSPDNPAGFYRQTAQGLEITTGPQSYFRPSTTELRFAQNRVAQIIDRRTNQNSRTCQLEPELITNVTQQGREKRRLVRFQDIPPTLVQAVVSVEDKRFFEHQGFDPRRILRAAWVDVKSGRKEQGASTLSMQLARNFWLDQQKTWGRKVQEALITLELEAKLNKQQIFEYYANEVYLGQRGSFSIQGFGEAARAYFGKDLKDLTLPEAALLAGMIQRPAYFNPFRWPQRALARRAIVLGLMKDNGYLTEQQAAAAGVAPLRVARGQAESSDAPYFVDLVNNQLEDQLPDEDLASKAYRVYTTLDLNLQREAVAAVQIGMAEVDRQLRGRPNPDGAKPQVALVALDPRTGAVKALLGGRGYAESQLNRALALRPPGSIFKPFVYAYAFDVARHPQQVITPATVVQDEPTTFRDSKQVYEPNNFHNAWHGPVTLREALVQSMNVPTVKTAEMAGYRNVASLAESVGLDLVKPTPSLALGTYEVKTLDIAGAYTLLANQGQYVPAFELQMVKNDKGEILLEHKVEPQALLDKRAAYLVTDIMSEVLQRGTGAGVRARGFTLPAAGKTGTANDGWFAGYTTELLCVVWVGFDDNRELGLEGAKSALPIWTEFMKRAHRYREYRDAKPFAKPNGLVTATIDPESGQLATRECPVVLDALFLQGTAPAAACPLHGGSVQVTGEPGAVDPRTGKPKKKRGVFGRIFGVFR